ncbi:MAG: glycosyltransferase [Alistipes sp.]|nr:glycosyltransferase [Alistipes sp.]
MNNILDSYTWQGLALLAVVLLLFFVQLYYYGIAYYRIYRFRLMRRRRKVLETPPISVIVAVRGEDEKFLTEELPALLHQKYGHFEVVVVYIGNDVEYYEELQNIRNNYSYMRLTKMSGSGRIYISTKQALNVGIKSAQYDSLLFTTTGAMPRSDEWLDFMAKGFERGEVIVGSAVPHFQGNSIKTYIMRMVELHRLRNAISRGVIDKLYYAPRSNYGFSRRLYNSTRGYNHLGIDIGDNDLYIQDIVTPQATAVVLSPHSIVEEDRPEGWSEWLEHIRYYDSTRKDYPLNVRTFISRERGSRMLFFLATIVAIVVLPLELKLAAIIFALLRYAVVVWSSQRVARKLGERNIALKYWIYDLSGPIIEWIISSNESHNTPKLWR